MPNVTILPTPIDDLESFALVLIYNALLWTPKTEKTRREVAWWTLLNKGELCDASLVKQTIFDHFSTIEKQEMFEISGIVTTFGPLIGAWARKITEFADQQERYFYEGRSSDDLYQLSVEAYKALVRIGLEEVANLPDVLIQDVYPESPDARSK
ncbi:hypothetical protein HGRIS_010104 [Hohenbuehelia grisea]|uniref:Uncharacterized protein n=1 Tax=Hohenbuehelia grisea TaxID=104357 RepID=A0ABR3J385_9AGAR